MASGISPTAAADVVAGLAQGSLGTKPTKCVIMCPQPRTRPRRSIKVATKRYGELWVLEAAGYLQQMKVVHVEVAARNCELDHLTSTRAKPWSWGRAALVALKQALGLNGALLGCDVLLPTEAMENASADLVRLVSQHTLHALTAYPPSRIPAGARQSTAEAEVRMRRAGRRPHNFGLTHETGNPGSSLMLIDTGDATPISSQLVSAHRL